jgi:hypothetical protein
MRLLILLFPVIVVLSTDVSQLRAIEEDLRDNDQSLRDTFVKWSFKRPSAVVRDLEIGLEKLKSLGFSETIHKGSESTVEIKHLDIVESERVLALQIIPELTRLESKSARNGSKGQALLAEVAHLKTEIKTFLQGTVFATEYRTTNIRINAINKAKVTIFEITREIASLIAKVKDMYGLRK